MQLFSPIAARMFPVVILCFAVTTGCGPTGPATHAVTGTVTYQGMPVEGATVSFSPQSEDGRPAVGITDSDGNYELTTLEQGDGALAGAYKVRVFKYDSPPRTEEQAAVSDEDYVPPAATDRPPPQPKHVLPEDYAHESRTPLRFEVEPGDDNRFDIVIE